MQPLPPFIEKVIRKSRLRVKGKYKDLCPEALLRMALNASGIECTEVQRNVLMSGFRPHQKTSQTISALRYQGQLMDLTHVLSWDELAQKNLLSFNGAFDAHEFKDDEQPRPPYKEEPHPVLMAVIAEQLAIEQNKILTKVLAPQIQVKPKSKRRAL